LKFQKKKKKKKLTYWKYGKMYTCSKNDAISSVRKQSCVLRSALAEIQYLFGQTYFRASVVDAKFKPCDN